MPSVEMPHIVVFGVFNVLRRLWLTQHYEVKMMSFRPLRLDTKYNRIDGFHKNIFNYPKYMFLNNDLICYRHIDVKFSSYLKKIVFKVKIIKKVKI